MISSIVSRFFSCLQDRAAPSLQPVARRPFALDLEACTVVGQQHEAGRARDQMAAGTANDCACLGGKVEFENLLQGVGPPDDGTESACAQKIVANAVALREPRLAGEIGLRVEKIDRLRSGCILNVKRVAHQRFVQIPGATDGKSRRRLPDNGLELGLRHSSEDPLENQEVRVLVAQDEGQVIGEAVAGPVALVEDGPGPLLPAASTDMVLRDASGPADGSGNGQLMHKCRRAGQPGPSRNRLLLKEPVWGLF